MGLGKLTNCPVYTVVSQCPKPHRGHQFARRTVTHEDLTSWLPPPRPSRAEPRAARLAHGPTDNSGRAYGPVSSTFMYPWENG